MSGGGGGGGYSPPPIIDCQSLSITTSLASPDPAVIVKLSKNDILTIQSSGPTGPLKAITDNGEIAGAIAPSDLATLIQCISDGHTYEAKVLSVSGGNCRILIKHE